MKCTIGWYSDWIDQYNGKGITTKEWWWKDQHSRKVLKRKKITHLFQKSLGLQEKASSKRNLQPKIPPQGQSALQWHLRDMQPGSTPSYHTAELPSPVLPGLTRSSPRCSISGSGHDSTVPIQLHLNIKDHSTFNNKTWRREMVGIEAIEPKTFYWKWNP